MKNLLILLLLYSLLISPVRAQDKTTPQQSPPQKALSEIEKARAEAEQAGIQAEPVISSIKQSVATLALELQDAEEEFIKAMETKEALATEKAVLELALAAQAEELTKQRVQVLSDRLQVLRERLKAEEALLKEKDSTVTLLERRSKLAEEIATTPLEKAATAQKEAEVAEAYLQAANAKVKEKETNLTRLKERLTEAKEKADERRTQLQKDLKSLDELPFRKEEEPQRFVRYSKFFAQIRFANIVDDLTTAEERIKLAEKELELARIDSANAQLEVALLKNRASLLGEKLKAEELKKKEEEAELARKAEEERKRTAEMQKAVVEREKERAVKEAEELAIQQLVAGSPEQKRVLEMESLVVTLKGEIAKRKDSLITEGTRRYEDNTEYKKLARDVQAVLGGENTPTEVEEEMLQLRKESTRWEEKLKTVESLAEAAQKEKALVTEKLEQARSELVAPDGEIPKIAKEAETFKDKDLAGKLTTYAQERVKLLEGSEKLVAALAERIEERKGIIQEGLQLLANATKELSGIKAANIWARRDWTASWLAMKEGLKRLASPKKPSDISATIEEPARKKLRLLLAVVGILALIAAVVFGSYYCIKWCRQSLKKLEETGGGCG